MRIFHGWFIAAAAFVTLFLTVGVPFYGMPFFYDYFIRDFGWTRAQTASGIALATILIQPAAGLLIHRFSPRRLILFGSGMLALALTGFSFGNGSLLLYYLAWGAFMTGYVYSGPLPHQVILSQWFRRNRGLAMGFAYLGLGLGGAVSQKYVALPLIQAFGWRAALLWMAASFVLLVPLLLFLVRDRPSQLGLNPDGDAQPSEEARLASKPFRQLLREPSFWLLAAGSACSIGAIGSVNQHMKLLFQDAGLSGSTVADTTFVILISSLAGRVVMGWMADRFSKKRIMLAAYLFVAAPLPLLFVIDRPGAPSLFATLFGFGLGADFMLIPLMAAQLFGANSLARVMGIVLPVDSVAQTCCPFLLGLMRDRFGDYRSGIILVAALALAGAAAVGFLPPLRAVPPLPSVRPTRESYESS